MAQNIYPDYPPGLTQPQRTLLLETLKDWSISHGLAVRPPSNVVSLEQDPNRALAVTAPVTLFPSPFPRRCFEEGIDIQPSYNELYAAVASDEEFLDFALRDKLIHLSLLELDDFVANLWQVHARVKTEGYVQDLSLGLFRSDYMVHVDLHQSPWLRQVEFNTIASSFGGLSALVSKMHKYFLTSDVYPHDSHHILQGAALPPNKSSFLLSEGLAHAHKAYRAASPHSKRAICVLFVVQDIERNVFDQRQLEYALRDSHGVQSFRLPFSKAQQHLKLNENQSLMYTPPHMPHTSLEVSVVYFRTGYTPDDYADANDWDSRYLIEKSRAIKCPTILTQLAGTKKVQQVLATPHSPDLNKFCANEDVATRIRKTFAPMYPMDMSPAGQQGRQLAVNPETAEHFVLKPQREGGGNNVYRKDIPGFLQSIPESHWSAYVLMEMIEPPALKNIIFRNGETQQGGVICELGVYGCCLWRSKIVGGAHVGVFEMLQNTQAGHLLRTKGDQSQEGGVAAGYGAVDSVCLVDV